MWSKHRSLRSNIATQIFSHKCGFSKPYHLDKADNENVGYALRSFVSDFGAPEHLKYDGAAELVQSYVGHECLVGDRLNKILFIARAIARCF